MKVFLLKNDKNRIYFQNYERISAEEELKKLQSILKKENISIGKKHETPLDDLYDCEIDGNPFTIVRTEEETFLYAECTDTIEKLLKIFEWGEYGR